MLDKAGSFDWKVPSVNHVRTQCRIRVEIKDADGNLLGSDLNNHYFTITP